MLAYFLIGILIIALAALAFLFLKEKKSNAQREENLRFELSKAVTELNQKQTDSENRLSDSISHTFNKINTSADDTAKQFNKKLEALSALLEQLNKENALLRKKLEFFTEIDSDSQNINEAEDTEERDKLIQQALNELSAEPLIQEDPAGNTEPAKEENKTEKQDKKSGILDEEQTSAFNIMEKTTTNLFITGKAGTGKSFLLDMFRKGTKKEVLILAPTGISALNVNGTTIHTAFGFNNLEKTKIKDLTEGKISLSPEKQQVLKKIDTLIIDEISMVRVDTFDKIDIILKTINNSDEPFGGKQVIVFGDLFQLPPIATAQDEKYLSDYYGGIFFFNSKAYRNGKFGFIELTENHRQKEDRQYFEILNRIREGCFDNSDLNKLNTRLIQGKEDLRRVMTLFPKKADAEALNKEELARIEAKEYVYTAQVKNALNDKHPQIESNFPITEELHLKRGALVMMVANDPDGRWVNGTIGIVHSLLPNQIKVTINGKTYEVTKTEFKQREAIYENDTIEYKDTFTVEQYPVVLAYAITIHKSQGMSYKTLACDISKCFAPGQAYVALSRCSSLNGLHLLAEIHGKGIRTNKTIMDFYNAQSTEETLKRFN